MPHNAYLVQKTHLDGVDVQVEPHEFPDVRTTHIAFVLQHLPIFFTIEGKAEALPYFVAEVAEATIGDDREKRILISIRPPNGCRVRDMLFGAMRGQGCEYIVTRVTTIDDGQLIVTLWFHIINRGGEKFRDWPYKAYGGDIFIEIAKYGRLPAVPQP